jgi:predicted nuclease of predicted toxin-antitoxin system
MNLVADEGVDRQIIEFLRKESYEVFYVAETQPSISDEKVLQEANKRSALLVTTDKDFGELVFRQGRCHSGVVLIRLDGLTPNKKTETVAKVFHEHVKEMHQKFTVITPGLIRIRPRTV